MKEMVQIEVVLSWLRIQSHSGSSPKHKYKCCSAETNMAPVSNNLVIDEQMTLVRSSVILGVMRDDSPRSFAPSTKFYQRHPNKKRYFV